MTGNRVKNEVANGVGNEGGERCRERGWQPSEDAAGEEVQAYVVGDRLVLCPLGQVPAPSAHEHAVHLLAWVSEKYPAPARQLWVASHDLEHTLYPQLLSATEWPPYRWKTVAGHLRKLTDWRRRDGRQDPGGHGSSPVEYLIRGPRKRRPNGSSRGQSRTPLRHGPL